MKSRRRTSSRMVALLDEVGLVALPAQRGGRRTPCGGSRDLDDLAQGSPLPSITRVTERHQRYPVLVHDRGAT